MTELSPDDIDRVARLHARVFGGDGPTSELASFLHDIFFGHPWSDGSVRPLKLVDARGRLIGCLGAMPRPMTFDGRAIRAVVSHNYMVHPDRRGGLAAIKLLRAMTAQDVDLVLSEANGPATRIGQAVGAEVLETRSKRWIRVLKPSAFGLHVAAADGLPRWIRGVLRGGATAVDGIVGALQRPLPSGADEPLTPTALVDLIDRQTRDHRLRPVYTERGAAWLLSTLAKSRKAQTLRARVVLDRAHGGPIGWYLYYSRAGGIGRVLQVGAPEATRRRVFEQLFADAQARDNVAVAGQLEPGWTSALDSSRCLIRSGRTWLIASGRDRELMSVLDGPDAYLTRLEGEGWLRFSY